jgi:hypothetical protein
VWASYSTKINKTSEQYDLILVDGRFRVACACAAYLNLKDTGFLLIHDYASRSHYHPIEQFYTKVEEIEDLCVFKKNKNCNTEDLKNMHNKYMYTIH